MVLIIKVSHALVLQDSHLYMFNNPEIILDLKTVKLVLMVILILIIKVSHALVLQDSHLYMFNNPEIILDLKTLELVLMVI